MKAGLKMDSN